MPVGDIEQLFWHLLIWVPALFFHCFFSGNPEVFWAHSSCPVTALLGVLQV